MSRLEQARLPSAEQRVQERLPAYLDYSAKSIAPPCQNARYFCSAQNGNTFTVGAAASGTMKFSIPCGTPGVHLNTNETVLVFTINNNSGQTLTLDGSALAAIFAVDTFYGSTHISSIQHYNDYVNTVMDFTSYSGYEYVQGGNEFALALTGNTAADINTGVNAAFYARNGETIANGASATFAVPVVNFLGSLASKGIPLSQLKDSINIDFRLSALKDLGTYGADVTGGVTVTNPKLWLTEIHLSGEVENAMINKLPDRIIHIPSFDVQTFTASINAGAGSFIYQIPVRVSSLTQIIVCLHETAVYNTHNQRALSRTKGGLESYRFRIGSTILPSTYVECAGNGCEARLELMRSMNQIQSAAQQSYVSTDLYNLGDNGQAMTVGAYGCFAFGLNLSALSMAEIISDGRSTRSEYITLDMKFKAGAPALQANIFATNEILLVAQNGLLTYEN